MFSTQLFDIYLFLNLVETMQIQTSNTLDQFILEMCQSFAWTKHSLALTCKIATDAVF